MSERQMYDSQNIKTEFELTTLLISAAFHPLDYARTLMHLGYEPIPAVPGTLLTGETVMWLPNYFQYIGHIRRVDGLYGLYRGLVPKVIGRLLSLMWQDTIADEWGFYAAPDIKDENTMTQEELYFKFKQNLKRSIAVTVSGIVVARPFHVISIRMMAQFVGRETVYKSIWASILEIYKTEGIGGFFSGLKPKLFYEVGRVIMTSATIYLINKFILPKKKTLRRNFVGTLVDLAFQVILYPLTVVSTCMTVCGARLKAGQPPAMPLYPDWLSCYDHLESLNALKRGSSIFRRCVFASPKPMLKYTNGFAFLESISNHQ